MISQNPILLLSGRAHSAQAHQHPNENDLFCMKQQVGLNFLLGTCLVIVIYIYIYKNK